jgi:outer membrane biogenesis lipoprotein LolB
VIDKGMKKFLLIAVMALLMGCATTQANQVDPHDVFGQVVGVAFGMAGFPFFP